MLQRADDDALEYVVDLLRANDLPVRDVRSKPDCFFVGRDGDARVGVVGLEVHGADGLLRSLVVDETVRGEGYGTALIEAIEAHARESGIHTVSLLTTTAAPFFVDRGYEEIDRTAVPDAIQRTDQFADLCPSSAVCLRTVL